MVPFIPTKNLALVGVFLVWLWVFLSGWGFFGGCFGEEEKGNASLALIGAATEGLERFHSLHGDFPWTLDTWGRRTGHVRGKTRARRSRNVQSQRSGRASLQQGLLEAAP